VAALGAGAAVAAVGVTLGTKLAAMDRKAPRVVGGR